MYRITPDSSRLGLDPSSTNCNNILPFYHTPPYVDPANNNYNNSEHKDIKIVDPSKKSIALIINNISILLSKFTRNLQVGKIDNSIQSIRKFIIEILKRSKCNKTTTLIASYYLNKLYQSQTDLNKLPDFAKCSKRIFLTCLIISHKFLTDNTYTMKTWSQITGLSVKALNDMERWCLNKLNYGLFVKKELLQHWTLKMSQNTLDIKNDTTTIHEKRRLDNNEQYDSSCPIVNENFNKKTKVSIN